MPEGFREAYAGSAQAQKHAKGAPAYSRFINRRAGRILVAAAQVAGFTPNQLTTISAALTVAGIAGIALLPASPLASVEIVLLLLLGYAFDSADGQLARLRGGGTLAGEWLDHVVDAAKVALLHLAVFVHLVLLGGMPWFALALPLAFQAVASILFFAMILTEQLRRRAGIAPPPAAASSPLYSLAVAPTDYGVLCIVFALLWWQPAFLAIYALLLFANAAFLVLALAKWFGELKRT
jgi:phosphatidylglycerophosphate synthase